MGTNIDKDSIIRIVSFNSIRGVKRSLQYTFRKLYCNDTDRGVVTYSYSSKESSDEVSNIFKEKIKKIKETGNQINEKSILCIAYFFGPSPNMQLFRENEKEYFLNCLQWVEHRHGKDNVISFHVQIDETVNQAVAYVLPMTKDGRLNASSILGGRKKQLGRRNAFINNVIKHGVPFRIKNSNPATQIQQANFHTGTNVENLYKELYLQNQNLKYVNMRLAQDIQKQTELISSQDRFIKYIAEADESNLDNDELKNKAIVSLVSALYSKNELELLMEVNINNNSNVFDALVSSGKARDFTHSIELVSLRVKVLKKLKS